MSKKIAIIGAGVAGLAAIKNALDAGLEPTAFEKSSWLGGIWYYTEDDRLVAPKSTILNTSKHFTCFTDFPVSKDMPNYLTRGDFQRYLELYAQKFDLKRRIQFNCEVLKVDKCEDYEDTGRWKVHSKRSNGNGKDVETVEVFDCVVVCSGIFAEPYLPNISGLDEFTGRMIHSISYKTFKPFEGRRVLVVGIGNTAADIACELSRHAKQVYLSTRRGTYIIPRMAPGGIPADLTFLIRFFQSIPKPLLRWMQRTVLSNKFNLRDLGLEPDPKNPKLIISSLVNDELPHRIVTGTVVIKDAITGFKNKKVFFEDDTVLDDIDDVIFATGFNLEMPFLPKSVFDVEKAQSGHVLYKTVFPSYLPHSTLAFIGFFRNQGAVIPLMDLQGRWVMQVFKGTLKLPCKEIMDREIEERRARSLQNNKESATSFSYILTEGYIGYMDDIASILGVKPNFWKLFIQDPVLAMKCFFGPCVPAQYRLMGSWMWPGARQVIEQVEESRLAPLATRKVKDQNKPERMGSWWILLVIAIIVVALIILYK